ncbi:hypothetical protein BXZ70DRAFT_1010112 [Cristinia sonorae]|uniref:Uncharacterized protein n=1 Tax=Cristinia sonorae TaxID=1940300 RepID=A0A8K0XMQ2_9AGAR|nr:hypothetical protein BXZ70DRAFT_1010112 [Cristinia sonorae]
MSQYSSTPAHISEDDGVSYDTQRNPPVVQRFDAVTNYPLTAPPSSDFHPNTFDFWNELDFDAQASSSVDPAWLDNISCSGNKELAMLMPDEFDKDIEALANFDHAFKSAAVPPSLGDDFYNFGSHGAFQLVGNSIQYADQLQSDMRSSTAPSTSAASASTSISNSSFGSDWLSLCDPYQISDDGGASEYLESHYGSVPGPSPFPSGGGPVNQESESFGEEKLSGSTSLHAFELDSALRVPALDNTAAAGTLGTQQDEPEKGWACPECPQRKYLSVLNITRPSHAAYFKAARESRTWWRTWLLIFRRKNVADMPASTPDVSVRTPASTTSDAMPMTLMWTWCRPAKSIADITHILAAELAT